ncbi:hypothetical protein [Pontibacter vulgaris]|uniref:hypothetical protein n=1 Tax=Pontibacter vulgaris TaxID=2905679 RepID=UPI001FA75AFA|nr:hypothetical protein [Pontibacter vulgaris]
MEEIVKLSKIVTQNLKPNSVLPPVDLVIKGKEKQLLSNILAGNYTNDDNAASDIYGSNANDTRYKMLKTRIKRKLFDYLFFLELPGTKSSSAVRDELLCIDYLHHAKVLLLLGEFDITIRLLNKAYSLAQENSYTEILINCLELKNQYYSYKEHGKLLDKNLEILKEYRTKRAYEVQSIEIYQKAKIKLNKSILSRTIFLAQLGDTVNELERLWKLGQTFTLFDNYYKLQIWYYELLGDFRKIINITQDTYELLKKGAINGNRFDERYNEYILVYSLLREKDFVKGLSYAERFIENFNIAEHNWFAFMENYFLLAMHSRNYELAHMLIDKVFTNTSFNRITKTAKERWNLFKTYLQVITPTEDKLSGFNFQSFAISVPEYSKDKQGFNVAILILQFIYFLKKGDAEALLYRIESLRKYILTHLKDAFSLRSKTFLKLLMLTVTEDFNVAKCKNKGDKYLQKLLETHAPGDAYAEIEIVPYEHLWELILEILKKREK